MIRQGSGAVIGGDAAGGLHRLADKGAYAVGAGLKLLLWAATWGAGKAIGKIKELIEV